MPANLARTSDMKITNATGTWQSVTTAADEIWQVREGSVEIDVDATEGDRGGLLLQHLQSVTVTSGKTVYYKLASGTSAVISRNAL